MALSYQKKICPFKENSELIKMINYKEHKFLRKFTTSIKKVTTAATGFPGKPINGVLFNFPKAKGLPGFKDNCQKLTLPEVEKKFPM